MHTLRLAFVALLLTASASAQSWTSVLSTSRAIDWSKAGLPATYPDGETTPNPWTPPTRPACTTAQAGITVPVASGTSFASIVTAMGNCSTANPTGSYLLLGAGSFAMTGSASIGKKNVTLRGSGPMSTTLTISGTLSFGGGGSAGGGALNASPSAGATSVTVVSAGGSAPVVGDMGIFNQCDSGYSGSTQPTSGYNLCTTGSYTDNGAVFVCGGSTVCNSNGSGSGGGGQTSQFQYVEITSVTNNGGGSYTLGFSPGLYLPNWSTSNTAALYWQSETPGVGFEDMTALISGDSFQLSSCYGCWIKGVRFIGPWASNALIIGQASKNALIFNNYFFSATPATMTGNSFQLTPYEDSDSLILNNIAEQGAFLEGHGSSEGDVIAYNWSKNVSTNYVQATYFYHNNNNSGSALTLNEGNIFNSLLDDDTWGTSNLNTYFRNWASCSEEPFVYGSVTGAGIAFDAFHRFANGVGNVIGGTSQCNSYSSSSNGAIWRIGARGSDTLTSTSSLRWFNYDTITATTRCQSSEVPTTLTGNAIPFENSVPANCAAPASFYMNSITPHPSGGTGLSWWKVCTSWNTFPTSCASSTTEPFPAIGPDVSGGAYIAGFVYPNPAYLAWQKLPIDTTLQNSYTITGSSWSGGTETLTVSGLPSGTQVFGPLQISGGNCATSGAGTATGTEVQITGSSTTTIQYALGSNPGACTGTMLWPDVRQFDEKVYQTDSLSSTLGSMTTFGATIKPGVAFQ